MKLENIKVKRINQEKDTKLRLKPLNTKRKTIRANTLSSVAQ